MDDMNVPPQKPSDTQANDSLDPADAIRRTYNHFNLQLYVEMGEQRETEQSHENCMQTLRKDLDHLKATEWQYMAIEKYIGQS